MVAVVVVVCDGEFGWMAYRQRRQITIGEERINKTLDAFYW